MLRPQVVTRDIRKTYFGLPKKSLVPSPDFDIMPRNPDTSRDGNRDDPDSAEEPEPSCSAEGLVTPLLGTQSAVKQEGAELINEFAVRTDKLTRTFDDYLAVDAIDLRVSKGSSFGFLGPNGAGKSTTIKMLTGLLAPTSGTVEILGQQLAGTTDDLEVRRRIGVVPEGLALFDYLTGIEYLTFIGRIYGLEAKETETRIESLLSLMKLDDQESKLTMDYSSGMKKKLAIAAALIGNPELLFLDEPFEGVDAVNTSVLCEIFQSFVRGGGTIFLTSHVLEFVERLCTDVAIISRGSIVHEASMKSLDGSLEKCFLEVVGKREKVVDLEWLAGKTGRDSFEK